MQSTQTQLIIQPMDLCSLEVLVRQKLKALIYFHPAQGIEIIDDISDSQVEACAGGPILRTEVIYFALQKNSKHIHRSIQILLQALEQVKNLSSHA